MHRDRYIRSKYALPADVELALDNLAHSRKLQIDVHYLGESVQNIARYDLLLQANQRQYPQSKTYIASFTALESVNQSLQNLRQLTIILPKPLPSFFPTTFEKIPGTSDKAGLLLSFDENPWSDIAPLLSSLQAHQPNVGAIARTIENIVEKLLVSQHPIVSTPCNTQSVELASFTYLLSNLSHWWNNLFDVSPFQPQLNIEGTGRTVPNPASFFESPQSWVMRGIQSLYTLKGLTYGNLSLASLFKHRSQHEQFYLIHWDKWIANSPLIPDWVALELDILTSFMKFELLAQRQEWLVFLDFITQEIHPPNEPDGLMASHAWRLIRPLRRQIASCIQSSPAVAPEIEASFWLYCSREGLQRALNPQTSPSERIACYLYAAYSLGPLLTRDNLKKKFITVPRGRSGSFAWSHTYNIHSLVKQEPDDFTSDMGVAFIVGIGGWADDRIPKRPVLAHGALELAELLRQRGYHTQTIIDEKATRQTIYEGLSSLSKTEPAGGNIIFYFAGHGHVIHDEYFFLSYDTNPDELKTTCLGTQQLSGLLAKISQNAKRVLVILDSCYSEGAMPPLEWFYSGRNREMVVISSCTTDEKSYVAPHASLSLFTQAFINGLEGTGTPGSSAYVDVFDVFRYISQWVPVQASQYGWSQTPSMSTSSLSFPFPLFSIKEEQI